MQFDITGFLIFLGFILPGFVAQKTRYSIVPRPLKPLPPISEIGELVLTGVWIHAILIIAVRAYFLVFQKQYFVGLANAFYYGSASGFFWAHRSLAFGYFIFSLLFGYGFGFVHGIFILRQPVRSWIVSKRLPSQILKRLGLTGFLQEEPVWYFVLKQKTAETMVFLEVEMKNGVGFYTGELKSYGILDDAVKSKDFYIEDVFFKERRTDQFVPLQCNGLLVNFEDVASIKVIKVEPNIPS